MIVAVISDIHGNHYALEKVLNEAKNSDVEKLLVLGDIVGYYYTPDRILSMLDEWDYELIRGNHEILLQQLSNNEISLSTLQPKYGSGHKIALDRLEKEQIHKLVSAPDQQKLKIDNTTVLMCHGSNWDPYFYLYPDTDEEILKRSGEVNADFVFVGHSHYAFVHHNENNVLVNVGSVGQSRAKGGIANWLILDTVSQTFELKETSYDVNPLIEDVKKIDPEVDYLINVLKRNNEN
ncbi:metallophosphoesterase family protein [Ekhidna sp.]